MKQKTIKFLKNIVVGQLWVTAASLTVNKHLKAKEHEAKKHQIPKKHRCGPVVGDSRIII